MAEHSCTEFNPNCFRCDLSREEARRTESPTEGTAGLLERLLTDEYGDQVWNDLGSLRRIARVLDAHVTERCAEALEEAADEVYLIAGSHQSSQRLTRWLRDRAAAMRGEG